MILCGAMEKWQGFLKVLKKERIMQLIKIWCEVGPEFKKVLSNLCYPQKSANFQNVCEYRGRCRGHLHILENCNCNIIQLF